MWDILRNNKFYGIKFRRQVPIGNYVADFVCESKNLIIEIDGGQHNELQNIESDKNRTEYFKQKRYQVLRFWNNEIDNNVNGVCETIYHYVIKD